MLKAYTIGFLESVKGVSLQNLKMIVPKTLLCMMSVISATCLLMPCDSAVVKTRKPLYHIEYVTNLPSTTLLTGRPYYFVTYPPIQLGQTTAFTKERGTR